MKIFEVIFNTFYLITIWYFLWQIRKQSQRKTHKYLYLAFLWLAFGDTFHVGLRSIAHLLGDINLVVGNIKLIGFGAMMTAYTVTITYYYFLKALDIKDKWYIKAYNILIVLRLIIISFPINHWFSEASYSWGIIRNIPLILMGIIIVAVFLKEKGFYRKFGLLILYSYAFYLPVIFGVRFIPMLGMLMIPKTVMYLLMFRLYYQSLKSNQINSQPNSKVS